MPKVLPPTAAFPGQFSVRTMLVVLSLAVALPGWAFGAYLLQQYAISERARAELELEEDARGAANLVDAKFAAAEETLRILASSPRFAAGDLETYAMLL